MVNKEQALSERYFISMFNGRVIRWRKNGTCKTWKRDATRYRLPVKHGLYSYAYIDESNAHMFTVAP
jgi:hypothetical protein